MILIGTINLKGTKDQGEFRCPECRKTRPYRLRSVRPFLTLYFIPVLPIGSVTDYVECANCKEAFEPVILEVTTETAEALEAEQFRSEVMNAAVLTVVADGSITDNEIEALMTIGEILFEREFDREELGQLCASATQVGFKPHTYLRSVVMRWDDEQKYEAMKYIFLATSANGELSEQQVQALVDVRQTLGLAEEEFESAVEEAVAIAGQ